MVESSVLGELDVEAFLRRYWQKAPVLLRGGLRGVPVVSAEEILRLVARDDVESRLVMHRQDRWDLEHGPLSQRRLDELPSKDWSVLVSDLEQHLDALRPLLDSISFLPSWRIDDLMASVSAPGGSVGPHFDSYDVFLVQLSGEKHWQVGANFDRHDVRDDCDLCILNTFAPDQEWTLGPGDVLYLPPNVAHHGVARSTSITISIGCRTPSQRELLTHFAIEAIDRASDEPAYSDPDLAPSKQPYLLSPDAVKAMMSALAEAMKLEPEAAARGVARLLTQPKALFAGDEDRDPVGEGDIDALLAGDLRHARGTRWLAVAGDDGATLFVNGASVGAQLDDDCVRTLCSGTLRQDTIASWKQNETRSAMLRGLVRQGLLVAG
jgi:50S ribosomal protein L16 3-hydroxylase